MKAQSAAIHLRADTEATKIDVQSLCADSDLFDIDAMKLPDHANAVVVDAAAGRVGLMMLKRLRDGYDV